MNSGYAVSIFYFAYSNNTFIASMLFTMSESTQRGMRWSVQMGKFVIIVQAKRVICRGDKLDTLYSLTIRTSNCRHELVACASSSSRTWILRRFVLISVWSKLTVRFRDSVVVDIQDKWRVIRSNSLYAAIDLPIIDFHRFVHATHGTHKLLELSCRTKKSYVLDRQQTDRRGLSRWS